MGLNVVASNRRECGNLKLLFLMGLPRRSAPRDDNGNWKCTLLYPVTLGQCQLLNTYMIDKKQMI